MTRILLTVTAALALLMAMPTVAQERVTLTLRSGDRLTGDLVDLNGSGLVMRIGNDERGIPVADVAVIEFASSDQPAAVRPWLETGRAFVLLRDGSAVEGRLVDVGGTRPLRLSVDTPSGSRELTSADVAQVYLTRPPGLAAAAGETNGGGASEQKNRPPMGADLARGGTATVTVSGTHNWSPTNIMVRRNESIAFKGEGMVRLSANANDRVPAAGASSGQGVGPLPSAPRGALIARVDDGAPFLIGAGGNIRIPAAGRLVLGINDDHVGDNDGEFQVIVGVNPRSR